MEVLFSERRNTSEHYRHDKRFRNFKIYAAISVALYHINETNFALFKSCKVLEL